MKGTADELKGKELRMNADSIDEWKTANGCLYNPR